MSDQATPRPWRAIQATHGPVDVFDANGHDIMTLYSVAGISNAALIIRAVNSFDALVNACEAAMNEDAAVWSPLVRAALLRARGEDK